ncbi:MAG: hypothetical protein EOP56_13980 [Sphingobacteriales bacterium]|nr:MAG: hypothetical protein EOP56_13980 [Sphingobacteriales bacterium]
MKRILLAVMFSFAATTLFAQKAPTIPEDIEYETQGDFKKMEQYVMPIVNWIESVPMTTEDPTYKKASQFLMEWTNGSESVNLEFDQDVITFAQTSPDLLLYFITGWTRWELAHPGKNDKVKNNLAGIEGVLKFYKGQKDIAQNDELDMLYALREKNQLEGWVKKQLTEEKQ